MIGILVAGVVGAVFAAVVGAGGHSVGLNSFEPRPRSRARALGEAVVVDEADIGSPELARLEAERERLDSRRLELENEQSHVEGERETARAETAAVQREIATVARLSAAACGRVRGFKYVFLAAVVVVLAALAVMLLSGPAGDALDLTRWACVALAGTIGSMSLWAVVGGGRRIGELSRQKGELEARRDAAGARQANLDLRRCQLDDELASVCSALGDCNRGIVRQRALDQIARAQARDAAAARDREAAARKAEEAAEQAKSEAEVRLVQRAVVWHTRELPYADDFVRAHWQTFAGDQEVTILAEYNRNPLTRLDACFELARRTVPRMREELAYLLPTRERSVKKVALMVRRHAGWPAEVALPAARRLKLQHLLGAETVPMPSLGGARRVDPVLERKRVGTLRAAGCWWQSEGRHYCDAGWLADFVRRHRRWILRQTDIARAAYEDETSLVSTKERCHELAAWAIAEQPAEVIHHMNGAGLPSVERLASVFRAYHGRFTEVLLPAARNAPDETREASIFERLDPDARQEFERAQTVAEIERAAEALIEREPTRLRTEGVPEQSIEAHVQSYAKFMREAAHKLKLERGFING